MDAMDKYYDSEQLGQRSKGEVGGRKEQTILKARETGKERRRGTQTDKKTRRTQRN